MWEGRGRVVSMANKTNETAKQKKSNADYSKQRAEIEGRRNALSSPAVSLSPLPKTNSPPPNIPPPIPLPIPLSSPETLVQRAKILKAERILVKLKQVVVNVKKQIENAKNPPRKVTTTKHGKSFASGPKDLTALNLALKNAQVEVIDGEKAVNAARINASSPIIPNSTPQAQASLQDIAEAEESGISQPVQGTISTIRLIPPERIKGSTFFSNIVNSIVKGQPRDLASLVVPLAYFIHTFPYSNDALSQADAVNLGTFRKCTYCIRPKGLERFKVGMTANVDARVNHDFNTILPLGVDYVWMVSVLKHGATGKEAPARFVEQFAHYWLQKFEEWFPMRSSALTGDYSEWWIMWDGIPKDYETFTHYIRKLVNTLHKTVLIASLIKKPLIELTRRARSVIEIEYTALKNDGATKEVIANYDAYFKEILTNRFLNDHYSAEVRKCLANNERGGITLAILSERFKMEVEKKWEGIFKAPFGKKNAGRGENIGRHYFLAFSR
jgi:hypothetical protein